MDPNSTPPQQPTTPPVPPTVETPPMPQQDPAPTQVPSAASPTQATGATPLSPKPGAKSSMYWIMVSVSAVLVLAVVYFLLLA